MGFLGDFLGGVVGDVAGGLIGDFFGGRAQDRQASYNSALMSQQNEMNVENYKHRYQWQVEDMRNAGLNPVLSANLGAGSVGSSALAGVSLPTNNGISGLGNIVNSATANRQAKDIALKNLELQDRNTAVMEKDAETRRLDVLNQMHYRDTQLVLQEVMQDFERQLKQSWQDFEMDRKTRETDAYIEHLSAQNANLAAVAEAALRNSSVQERLAALAEENGITHRQLEIAEAALTGKKQELLDKYGDSEEVRQDLMRAETALREYELNTGPVNTLSKVMSSVLSLAVVGKIGYDVLDPLSTKKNPVGF